MKRTLGAILGLILLLGLLSACNTNGVKLLGKEFFTITDSLTGTSISIYESKKSVEAKLGEGKYDKASDSFIYEKIGLEITFYGRKVGHIRTLNVGEDRFILLHYQPGMSEMQVNKNYVPAELNTEEFSSYSLTYDKQGNRCSEYEAEYGIFINFENGSYRNCNITTRK